MKSRPCVCVWLLKRMTHCAISSNSNSNKNISFLHHEHTCISLPSFIIRLVGVRISVAGDGTNKIHKQVDGFVSIDWFVNSAMHHVTDLCIVHCAMWLVCACDCLCRIKVITADCLNMRWSYLQVWNQIKWNISDRT